VDRAARALGGYPQLLRRDAKPIWVDVGCGSGALLLAANDHGFIAGGLDMDGEAIASVLSLGYGAVHQDFMKVPFELVPDVLSLMDVLAEMPDPRAALSKAASVLRPGGVLVLGTADSSSASWRLLERDRANPHWSDPRLHHIFSRERLIAMLRDSGFEVTDFATPADGQARMQLYAIRS
jgi:2-polyprenyl-3-methyl-5-hydroxy-6-metoxy-1,4-benzoquinol methylase